jgi:hypothetical protein
MPDWRSARLAAIAVAAILTTAIPVPALGQDNEGYAVLLIGNSHSSRGDLPAVLRQLLEMDGGPELAHVEAARRWVFLAERLGDKVTQKALESREWSHVVLQAQKYSTSGRYIYPTDAAEEWIRRSRNLGAQPILFPEWARLHHDEEGARVHRLHLEIASREPACVAPVGLAWEIARGSHPDIRLHAQDGNHANRKGALLAAYVLYGTITGRSPEDLPSTRIRGVPEEIQIKLREAAGKAISQSPPCASGSA